MELRCAQCNKSRDVDPTTRYTFWPCAGCGAKNAFDATTQSLDTGTNDQSPAAMLGEAAGLARRIEALLDAADPKGEHLPFLPVAMAAGRLTRHIEDLKREAEARESKPCA